MYPKLNKGEKTPPERKYTRAEDVEKMYRTHVLLCQNMKMQISVQIQCYLTPLEIL
jgi:hypothetical protein